MIWGRALIKSTAKVKLELSLTNRVRTWHRMRTAERSKSRLNSVTLLKRSLFLVAISLIIRTVLSPTIIQLLSLSRVNRSSNAPVHFPIQRHNINIPNLIASDTLDSIYRTRALTSLRLHRTLRCQTSSLTTSTSRT